MRHRYIGHLRRPGYHPPFNIKKASTFHSGGGEVTRPESVASKSEKGARKKSLKRAKGAKVERSREHFEKIKEAHKWVNLSFGWFDNILST